MTQIFMKDKLGKKYKIPQRGSAVPKINITYTKTRPITGFSPGDWVTWRVNGKKTTSPPPFIAKGKIIRIYTTTFGGKVKKQAAHVRTYGKYLKVFPNRCHTTVALDKLSII